MLKRQRASSPIPWTTEPTVEAEVAPGDLYEPDRKRRRYFTPSSLDKSLCIDSASHDWESESDEVHLVSRKRVPEYSRGMSGWQQQAGEYRDANTLLHDLHAEQRHRTIFAIRPSKHLEPQTPCLMDSSSHGPNTQDTTRPPQSQVQGQPPVVEAKRVAGRYEDTNKLLGSLVLSRRRRLDHDTP